MTPTAAYRMTVHDVFRFSDGSTLFLGRVEPDVPRLIPAQAEVVVGGKVIARIQLTEERMPGPSSRGRRSLVTRDRLDHEALKTGPCALICQL